jgi:DNA-binding MarR family transcriptional regulator
MAPKSRQKSVHAAPRRPQILGLIINTLGRNVIWNLARRTAPEGVFPGQYPIIACLLRLEHATQAELSRLVGIEQSTMAVTLRRMEREGLIRRSADPDHSRKSRVYLTPRGRKLSFIIQAAALEMESIARAGLSDMQVRTFFRAATTMNRNLEAERHRREREEEAAAARGSKRETDAARKPRRRTAEQGRRAGGRVTLAARADRP